MILIACLSKGRSQTIAKETFSWLKYSKYNFKVFVEPQDYDDYCKSCGEENTINIGENDKGIWFVKRYIKKYALENKYEYIFKLDDDVISWRNPANRGLNGNRVKTTKEHYGKVIFDKMIQSIENIFDNLPEIGGISLKYGNEMREYDLEYNFDRLNSRFQTCYAVRTELFHYNKNDSVFEDFSNYMFVIKSGFQTLRYSHTGIDCKRVGSNSGGIQSFDRQKKNEESVIALMEEFPEIIWKEVNKDWNFEPDFKKMKDFVKTKPIQIYL